MDSTRGQLLIATPRMADPNFSRTVLLMVQHDDQGAMGLILNRPLETTVREVCAQVVGDDCLIEAPLYQGGPCEGPLMVLHGSELLKDMEIADGIFMTTDREKIEAILKSPPEDSRFFAGYAGWAAGQLEAEMQSDSWLLSPATPALIFGGKPNLWSKLMTQRRIDQPIDPDRIPDDPSVN